MNQRSLVGKLVVLPAAVLLASASPAAAEPSAEEVAAARSLGSEGLKLADAGDCAGAIDRLEKAAKLFSAPTILSKLGECQIKQGHLVAGTETLRRATSQTLAPGASPAFQKAQERAKELLAANEGKIGKLRFKITPQGKQARVTVDGEAVSAVLVETERPTDPGARSVEVKAEGFKVWKQSVNVPEGGTATAEVQLVADAPPPAPSAPPPLAKSAEEPPPPPPPASSNVAAYAALGVGGVGLIVGTVFGLSASSKKKSLDDLCVDKHCPASSQSDIDSMKSAATISSIGFGVGVLGIGVGTVLLLTGGSAAPRESARVEPYIGLGAAGLRGAF